MKPLILSVIKSFFLKIIDHHTRPVGLNDVKAAASQPAPTVVGVCADRGIVGVSGGELFFVIIDDGVDPDQLDKASGVQLEEVDKIIVGDDVAFLDALAVLGIA